MLTPTERQAIIDAIDAGEYSLADALLEIATKQKGEDVRKAIYGGILLANESGEGAVDPKARELIALNKINLQKEMSALQKQMAQFIANNSGTTQATKRTADVLMGTATTISAASGRFSLDGNISDYDYIEIQYFAGGRTNIISFTPDQLRGAAHWSSVEYNGPTANDTYTAFTNYVFSVISHTDPTLDIVGYKYVWDGQSSTTGLATLLQSTDNVKIMNIKGVKYNTVDTTTKDSELTDLRVGFNDTEYDSAGEAIRAQIAALWEEVNALKLSQPEIDGNGYLRFDNGGV